MGPKKGIKFGLPAEFYPRFCYFQRRLKSIVPRFESILGFANLSTCISEGKVKLAEINDASKHLNNRIKVTVVGGDQEILENFESEIIVTGRDTLSAAREWTAWVKVLIEMEKSTKFDPHFLVYLMDSPTKDMILDLEGQFSSLMKDQLHNIIIFDTVLRKNYQYVDCLNESGPNLPTNEQSHSVSQQIQFILEDRVVTVLEEIVLYANNFAVRPVAEPGQSLLDECSTQVLESLNNPHMLKDLDPETEFEQEQGSMETDQSPSTSSEPETSSLPQSKEEIFREKVMNFMFKKTKCIICDNLAKRYGINPSLVNEFMNEAYHGYEKKYLASCENLSLPSWSDIQTKKNQLRVLNYSCVLRQSSTIHETETYVREKMKVLTELSKLVFEIYALLRDTVVKVSVEQPDYPKLTDDLQDKLLEVPEITGCGTVYGKLTLHSNKDLSFSTNQLVRDLLQEFRYPLSYEVQLVQDTVKQAGPTPSRIECGNELQARLTPEGRQKMEQENIRRGRREANIKNEKTGTLGCFVKLSKTNDNNEANGGDPLPESSLYAVTCAHCVTDSLPEIQVKKGTKLENFGITDSVIDDGERLDIAVVKVNSDKVKKCETCICAFTKDWVLYDGQAGDSLLEGKAVHKRGCFTGLTTGVIKSNNFRIKTMSDCNRLSNCNFDHTYNILIDAEPGSGPGAAFSKGGDSGSAVYYELFSKDGIRTTNVVVSLVQGSMTNGGQYHCTYSCHMKNSLEELCSKYNYRLEYPSPSDLFFSSQGRNN